MIANSKAEDTFVVITHCDKEKPSEQFISGKLNSFAKYGSLVIPPNNVIKFNNTTESLREFISKLKTSNMHFHENLKEKADEIGKELPGDFKRQDDAEGTQNQQMH